MNGLDPYDADAGADRIDRILTRTTAAADGTTWPAVVIAARLRIIPCVAPDQDEAELASLYRAWTSEMIIVLTDPRVRHIATHGNRVSAVYATPTDADVTVVFYRAARANTLTRLINDALAGRGRDRIEVGLGLDYGQLINLNTGSGPTPQPPTYPIEPITRAERLAGKAGHVDPIWYTADFVAHLDQRERGLLTDPFPDYDHGGHIYTGNPIEVAGTDRET